MYQYKATVVRVVDGDTVRFKVDVGFYVTFEENFRLAGINAPELHDSNIQVKEAAHAAKDYLVELLPVGSTVTILTGKTEKYGRWLATVVTSTGLNVGDELVKRGYAKDYQGGKR